MQRVAARAIARTGHFEGVSGSGGFICGRDNGSMQTSTHPGPNPAGAVLNIRRPVSPTKLGAILQIEFRTIRSANHPECTISPPRWRDPASPSEPNWTIDPPRECPDGCHLLINMVASDLATRYQLERRARRRAERAATLE
jgi:hypothetical protein